MYSEFHDDRPTKLGVTALHALNDNRTSQRLVSCVTNYRLGVFKPSHYTLHILLVFGGKSYSGDYRFYIALLKFNLL